MPKNQYCGYICGIMTTYQQILIILDNFEINFIGALFPPRTAVAGKDYNIFTLHLKVHAQLFHVTLKLYIETYTVNMMQCSLYWLQGQCGLKL